MWEILWTEDDTVNKQYIIWIFLKHLPFGAEGRESLTMVSMCPGARMPVCRCRPFFQSTTCGHLVSLNLADVFVLIQTMLTPSLCQKIRS